MVSREAAIGARAPGTTWTLASTGEPDSEIVITNISSFRAKVELHFYASYTFFENVVTTVEVPARGRLVFTLDPRESQSRWVPGTLRANSQSTDQGKAEIVVERASYRDVDGVPRARATGLLATRVE